MTHPIPAKPQLKQTPISHRVKRIPASDTKQMPMLAARIGDCVSLGQGVPSFETPVHITEAVCQALRDEPASGKYSLQPGMRSLRQAIAETLQKEKGILADPDSEIAVTVGAMEGLLTAILALVERGETKSSCRHRPTPLTSNRCFWPEASRCLLLYGLQTGAWMWSQSKRRSQTKPGW